MTMLCDIGPDSAVPMSGVLGVKHTFTHQALVSSQLRSANHFSNFNTSHARGGSQTRRYVKSLPSIQTVRAHLTCRPRRGSLWSEASHRPPIKRHAYWTMGKRESTPSALWIIMPVMPIIAARPLLRSACEAGGKTQGPEVSNDMDDSPSIMRVHRSRLRVRCCC